MLVRRRGYLVGTVGQDCERRGSGDCLGSCALRSVSDLSESSHHSHSAAGFAAAKEAEEWCWRRRRPPFGVSDGRCQQRLGRQQVFSEIALRL